MNRERVERRLAAVLAVDVAGYSRLMGEDEEGTLDALRAVRHELSDPKIKEHQGRIVKTMGDGLLVEFASVVGAVRCAVEMQRAMAERNASVAADKRIEFRVGIHQGDIIVEEGDIFGDGVNIAARLEGLAHPGGICVSRVVRDEVRDKLDVAFDDLGERQVKNIARPVHAFAVRLDRETAEVPNAKMPTAKPALTLPDKPSIAVLPFLNMSSDPEQEFHADGIAEDVITTLSRYPSLFVIARNSTFTYKGQVVETRQIGHELGVRYVLEGSLRKAGNRIRVTAQLIEAETGNHIWAERYDRDLADIFAVQDEISTAAATAIAPAIDGAERQRALRKPPESLDAWAAYQRGLWHLEKLTATDNQLAEQLFRKAVDVDPGFADAYVGLAHARTRAVWMFAAPNLGDALTSAETLSRQAAALEPNNADARSCQSIALLLKGDFSGALAEAECALAINANLANAHAAKANALIFGGHPKEGLESEERSIRLDPHSAFSTFRLLHVTIGHYYASEYGAAVEAAQNALRAYPSFSLPRRWLAAALGQLGRTEEAKEALEKAITVAPDSFHMYVRNRVPWTRPEDHEHMLDGLRKAGWEG
jgi:adenylate cyclase